MAHVAFDTLKFAETLIAAGMPEEQAKAFTEAQKEVFVEALDTNLATKKDIYNVKTEITALATEIAKINVELKLIKWLMGLVIAGLGAIILKIIF